MHDIFGLDVTMTFTPTFGSDPPFDITQTVVPDGCNSLSGSQVLTVPSCGTTTLTFNLTFASGTVTVLVTASDNNVFDSSPVHNVTTTRSCDPVMATTGAYPARMCGVHGSTTATVVETP